MQVGGKAVQQAAAIRHLEIIGQGGGEMAADRIGNSGKAAAQEIAANGGGCDGDSKRGKLVDQDSCRQNLLSAITPSQSKMIRSIVTPFGLS